MHRGLDVRVKNGANRAAALFAAAALFLLVGMTAAAELPSPNFMPGFPMIAGPQLMIMWQAVPGASKYKVLINGKEAAETAVFQAFLPAPEKAGDYEIQVQAVGADGAAGKLSEKKVVRVIKLEPPKNVTGRPLENGFALRWDTAPGAMIYNLYRSQKPGADYSVLASVQGNQYADTKVEKDKKYFYTVTSKDASGAESGRSEEVAYDPGELAKAQAAAVAEKVKEVLFKVELVKCVKAGEFGTFQLPNQIARDRDGAIYISDTQNRRIVVFDADLNFRTTFPPQGANYALYPLIGMVMSPENRLFIGVGSSIYVLSQDGRLENQVALEPLLEGKVVSNRVISAQSFAFDKDSVYVVDSFNKRILVLTADLKFDRAIDVSTLAGTLNALTVTTEGNLLFSDSLGGTVIEITKQGKLVKKFGEYGVVPGKIGRAEVVYKDSKGNYWISDSMATMIHVYDKDGKYKHDFAKNDTEYFPVVSSFSFHFDPKTRTLAFVESLNHDFCVIRIPEF